VRGIPLVSESAVELGRVTFLRAGCDDCHSGPAFTNNRVEQVRKDVEPVKTPSLLGVGTRSPLFHDGCAATLEGRFYWPCEDHDDLHGKLSNLLPGELVALAAYLRTL
jgi:cytochrome c peroxidase